MRELEAIGYLVREKVRDPRAGRIATIQTIFEEPVEVAESQVVPGPKKPVTRMADVGRVGVFTKDRSRRTETNNNPRRERSVRQCAGNPAMSLSEKVSEIAAADAAKLAELEAATLDAGLPASYARIKPAQRTTLLELLDVHGTAALVDAAKRAHRPENPTMHVHGWLRLWAAMPLPRTTRPAATLFGECDEGWRDDDDQGRAVKCPCRTAAVA